MRTSILTLTIICLGIQLSQAQNADNKLHHAIGAAAGWSTGYGLTWLGSYDKYKFQLTFCPYYVDDNWTVDDEYDITRQTQFSLGISFYRMLTDNKVINLFAYQGNHWFYDDYYHEYNWNWWGGGGDTSITQSKESFTVHSIGIGLEFKFLEKGTFQIGGGYAFSGNRQSLTITGEAGLFYNLGKK